MGWLVPQLPTPSVGASGSGSPRVFKIPGGEGGGRYVCGTIWVPRLTRKVRVTGTELGDVMTVPEELKAGFLPSVSRNAALERSLPGLRVPHARKTGTTIAGLVFRVSRALGL